MRVGLKRDRHFAVEPRRQEATDMLDLLYIGLALGFLVLSWGLVELCDRL